jgi:hypothetical protein
MKPGQRLLPYQRLHLLRLILRQNRITLVVHLAGGISFVLYGKVSGRGWFWFLLSLAARCVPQLLDLDRTMDPVISPTHKRTEGRAPVWGSEFTSKDAALQGGGPAETAARLNVKLRDLPGGGGGGALPLNLRKS